MADGARGIDGVRGPIGAQSAMSQEERDMLFDRLRAQAWADIFRPGPCTRAWRRVRRWCTQGATGPTVPIPDIDFSESTGDFLTGLRKGFGVGNVGRNGPTGPSSDGVENE